MFLFCAGSPLKKVKKKKKEQCFILPFPSIYYDCFDEYLNFPVSSSKLLSQNSIIPPGNWKVSSDMQVYNDLQFVSLFK